MASSAFEPDPHETGHDVPPEQAVMVVDMTAYSRLPEAQMAPVRSDLDSILDTAFTQSGLPAPRTLDSGYKDAGDGVILLLPPQHAARLVDPLLGNLSAALQRYEGIRMAAAPAIRLRAAVHVGPLTVPDHRGAAINDACRLVNSNAAYQAVAAAIDNGLFLAAVLSEPVYQRSVQAGRTRPELTDRHFLATTARVASKPGFEESCRIFVPGLLADSLQGYLAEPSPSPRSAPASPVHPTPEQPARPGAVFNFHAAVNDPVITDRVKNLRIDRRSR